MYKFLHYPHVIQFFVKVSILLFIPSSFYSMVQIIFQMNLDQLINQNPSHIRYPTDGIVCPSLHSMCLHYETVLSTLTF